MCKFHNLSFLKLLYKNNKIGIYTLFETLSTIAKTGEKQVSSGHKKGSQTMFDFLILGVLEAGLEPAQPQWPQDFKSCVSTSSTIRASL
jgi:hypothetical protein